MKVGIFVTGIDVPPGRESNVSGHMQLPVMTCVSLLELGHDVELIANEYDSDYVLPHVVTAATGLRVHRVPDGRRRGRVGMQNMKVGYRPLALVRQLMAIKRLTRDLKLDVLHIFGGLRMAGLGGVLKLIGVTTPVAVTVNVPVTSRVWRSVYRRVDALLASTDFVANVTRQTGVAMQVVRPGIVRDLRRELGDTPVQPPHRVLFWREATALGGGDLVLQAFDRLAPRYPSISFDLAVRVNRHEVPGVEELAVRHENVHVYRFPYPEGMSLASLVVESLCVVLPFTKLSINPQLAIAESLLAGAATIGTDIGSNSELIRHGTTGLLIPPGNVEALVRAIEQLLVDQDTTVQMGRAARADMLHRWNWEQYTRELTAVYGQISGATPRV